MKLTAKRKVENSIKPISLGSKKEKEVFEYLVSRDTDVADLLSSAKAIQDECEDYVVNVNPDRFRFNEFGGLTFLDAMGEVHRADLTPFAMSQLGTKLGIPIRYLEKCIKSGRVDLAQENVNSWVEDYNKPMFIRMHKGSVRGLLSTRFSVCDCDEILQVIDDKLNLDKFKVKGSYLSPERFHLRLVEKNKLFADDDLFAGFTIDSSDVGRSVLRMRFLIYKQVCTNGLIVVKNSSSLFNQKHIGITCEEFARGFSESLEMIPKISAEVRDKIERTKNVNFATDEKSLVSTIEKLRGNTKFDDTQIQRVLEVMQTTYDSTQWGFINSLTEVAQELTLEKRIEVEEYAGSLLIA